MRKTRIPNRFIFVINLLSLHNVNVCEWEVGLGWAVKRAQFNCFIQDLNASFQNDNKTQLAIKYGYQV